MVKKIKSSLSAKSFLFIALLLVLCGLLIYSSVVLFLPNSYTIVASDRINQELRDLAATLSETNFTQADDVLATFCRDNRASVLLTGWGERLLIGYVDKGLDSGDVFTTTLNVTFADRPVSYTLTVSAPISAGHELTMAFGELLPVLLVIVLFISALGAFICSRILVRPVLEISRISQRMAELDMSWSCDVKSSDELGVLAESLNTMARRLDAAMSSLEDANRQLRADMEQMAAMSKQRRDFFAAASHELKTPITIIKGQIEGMLMGIGRYKDVQGILPETMHEVERMEQLVAEILEITRLEMDGLAGHTGPVDFSSLTRKVVQELMPLAEERAMELGAEIPDGVTVTGAEPLLERAVHNIITNALRHSPAGEHAVVVLRPGRLTVRNSGVNIPEDELKVLFTPFARVEKSRNKASGGSGLGLYLVKTIIDLHGFTCSIDNDGDGVIFTVEWPQAPQLPAEI
ncbi:MAG TPA: HAMP domain-containing histidine kinase [Candidatus Scatomorpha gallistercoris]|nr:HAMP domain-containing histidine kinase [Candidatus Scatomorpha gallistercoris]